MRFHLLGLPHTSTTLDYEWCAYTSRIRRMADLLTWMGHDVFLYAGPENDAKVTEHIPVTHEVLWKEWWGEERWAHTSFNQWEPTSKPWQTFNHLCIAEMTRRIEPGDIILISAGWAQKVVAQFFTQNPSVEWCVGYKGTFSERRIFESYAWMHESYGREGRFYGCWTDAVIPPHFDAEVFAPTENPSRSFLLFMARRIASKGIWTAGDLAARAGVPLVVAGQEHAYATDRGPRDANVTYLGRVDGQRRIELLQNALALVSPTNYIEPGANVVVEAQMCGTPVLTTDWGVYTENVDHAHSGYRCRSMAEFVAAAKKIQDGEISPTETRRWATGRYSAQAVLPLWSRYFERLQETTSAAGWYAEYEPKWLLSR